MQTKKVAILMGSDSDWPVVKAAAAELKRLGIPCEAHILSAHRTPAKAAAWAGVRWALKIWASPARPIF